MDRMSAKKGDLVYIQDSRWWYGGLKSIHSVYGSPHDEDGIVYMNDKQCNSGLLVDNYTLLAEKEM